jgi:hypothetical protein
MSSFITKQNPLPNNCNICLEEKGLGSIIKLKLIVDPRKWNYQILNCGHVICNYCYKNMIINPKYKEKCVVCSKKTKVDQWLFFNMNSNKSWYTIAEWFNDSNDSILTDYDEKICINRALKDTTKNGFGSLYSIIIIKSIEIIKDERNKINIERKKIIKNNKKFKIKVNNKYNDLLKKYTIGWSKNKTLSETEKIKIKKKAIEYVNNTGSYICSNCNKNIQNRHKVSHSNKCLKSKSF